MAVNFRSRWPSPAPGATDVDHQNDLQLWQAREEIRVPGTSFYWTETGAVTGTRIIDAFITMACMAEDPAEPGAWSMMGCFGPIQYPGYDQRELFMWRSAWDAGGSGAWQSSVYSGGPDENGIVAGNAGGRRFIAYAFGGN